MTSQDWEASVAEGVYLRSQEPLDRWAIGDLCVKAIPPGKGSTERSTNQRQLEVFARATGLKLSLLKDCYRTSQWWPPGTRFSDISHAKHSTVAAKPNRVDLLLNDEMSDGLSVNVRDKVTRIEELLSDPRVRESFIARSRNRSRKVQTAAKAIEDEDLIRARTTLRIQEQDARARRIAEEVLAKADERAIRSNLALAKMVADLLDFHSVAEHMPGQYRERATDSLMQIAKAAQRVLDKLRPATRSPQPRTIIDQQTDDHSGVEHR